MVLRRSAYSRLAVTSIAVALFLVSGCSGGGDAGGGNLGSIAPTITAGQVTFVNNCAVELTLFEKYPPTYPDGHVLGKLAANGGTLSKALSDFTPGTGYIYLPYPNTTTIPDAYCDGWTALGGPPGKIQRQGFMWEGANVTYAAYCNPGLSGSGLSTCALQHNCSGPGMIQNGTFGTSWELNVKGGGSNDFVDLSTNYGSGPHNPPNLCPPDGPGPADNCVAIWMNIFFNVPVKWTTNKDCSFTRAAKKVQGLECLTAGCTDAYQYPIDDKQCACQFSSDRGYLVEYCPAGSPLPPVPTK